MTTTKWKDIFDAAANGDESAVKYFVEVQGIPVTSRNDEQQNLAHIAAEHQHLNVLKYVLSKAPALVKARDIYNNTVLYLAVEKGILTMVKFLIDEAQVDIYESINPGLGNNAVHVAAEEGKLDILKYFIEEKKVDVNIRSKGGESPLFLAAAKLRMPIVRYLVEKGNANVTMTDYADNNILNVAVKIGDVSVPKYLLDEMKVDIDVNRRGHFGRTIVYLAAGYNYLAFLKYFVEDKHADVNICDKVGRSPLHYAASQGNMRIVKFLVKHGIDVEIKDTFGRTAKDASNCGNITEYLDEVMYKRIRRSVPQHISGVGKEPSVFKDCNRMMKMLKNSSQQRREMNQQAFTLVFVFQNYLLLLTACLNSWQIKNQALLSPPEIVQSKIDLIALDAINSTDFK